MGISWGLQEVPEVPAAAGRSTGELAQLEATMAQVVQSKEAHGKAWRVASGPKDEVSKKLTQLKQSARQKFGPPEAYGYVFQIAPEVGEGGAAVTSFFFSYNPGLVVQGQAEAFEAKRQEKAAKAAERAKAAKAKKAA